MNTCLVLSFSLSYYTSYSLSRTCAFVSVCLCVCLSVCLIVTLWSFASILSVYLGICRVCLLIVYSCMCVLETPMLYIIFILPTFHYGLVACLNSVFLFICLSSFCLNLVFLFLCLSVFQSFSLSVMLLVFLFVCLSVFLSSISSHLNISVFSNANGKKWMHCFRNESVTDILTFWLFKGFDLSFVLYCHFSVINKVMLIGVLVNILFLNKYWFLFVG